MEERSLAHYVARTEERVALDQNGCDLQGSMFCHGLLAEVKCNQPATGQSPLLGSKPNGGNVDSHSLISILNAKARDGVLQRHW